MAEFKDVMYQIERMCAQSECRTCGLDKYYCIRGTGDRQHRDFAKIESVVMKWAAEHPEPKYPTWATWLESMNLIHVDHYEPTMYTRIGIDNVIFNLNRDQLLQRIPAEFAKAHNIPPINGKED